MLSKSVIQFSVDGPGCVPSLLFDQKQSTRRRVSQLASLPFMLSMTKLLRAAPVTSHSGYRKRLGLRSNRL